MDLEAVYQRHREGVLVHLARRTADPEIALDLWAETFAQAIAGLPRFRGTTEDQAGAWLYGIAQRQLAQFYRRGRAERRMLDRLRLERPPSTPEVLAGIERRAGLRTLRGELSAALEQLSPSVRAAIELRVIGELPYEDVAQRLGISQGAARVRVSRGLAVLADLLDRTTTEATT